MATVIPVRMREAEEGTREIKDETLEESAIYTRGKHPSHLVRAESSH